MDNISSDLAKEQYYYTLIDALITEHDLELKNRLQTEDRYEDYVSEHASKLLDDVIAIRDEKNIEYLNAEQIALEAFKAQYFK